MMDSEANVVAEDASRFTHGAVYHALYDRRLGEARRVVVDLIPKGSAVLDIACGTGELCFELAKRKSCRVVGVDLSRRMIEFAERRNKYDTVHFIHGDAAHLTDFESGSYDYATVLFLLHEVSRREQVELLNEALRVAGKVIVADSQVPLPKNIFGIALRLVEASGGPEHYRPFASYLASGGIGGILKDSRIKASVVHRSVFWHGCRELVMLEAEATTVL